MVERRRLMQEVAPRQVLGVQFHVNPAGADRLRLYAACWLLVVTLCRWPLALDGGCTAVSACTTGAVPKCFCFPAPGAPPVTRV